MRTNSGDRVAGCMASGSGSGLSEEGHRAILTYQSTACDLPPDLKMGLAPYLTARSVAGKPSHLVKTYFVAGHHEAAGRDGCRPYQP